MPTAGPDTLREGFEAVDGRAAAHVTRQREGAGAGAGAGEHREVRAQLTNVGGVEQLIGPQQHAVADLEHRVDAARFELRLPIGLRLARGCFSQSGRGCWRGSSKSPSGQPAHRKSRPINYFISTMRPIMRLLWGESVLILCLLAVGAQALPTAKQALLHHPQSAKTLRLSGGSPAPLLTKRTVFNAAIGLLGIEVGKPEHHCLHSA